jgi:Flp pilus assembly pilin Flp
VVFSRFWREEAGATMVEYAIMVVLIAAVGVVRTLGLQTNTWFADATSGW